MPFDPHQICFSCLCPLDEPDGVCPHCSYDNRHRKNGVSQLPFSIIGDKYLIGRCLGQGGFGITYLGYDIALNRRVAIKEYFPGNIATRTGKSSEVSTQGAEQQSGFMTGVSKFIAEAQTLVSLEDIPNVVRVYDAFLANNTAYIVMEYVEGETLGKYLEEHGQKISMKETVELLSPIMDSLDELHEQNIIHRDIKPNNLMLRKKKKQVVLLDFGAARTYLDTSNGMTAFHTNGYSPKEQYSRRGKQDGRTDEYALAATIYRCITGKNPPTSIERQLQGDPVPPPSKYCSDITPEQEKALLKGMSLEIDDRYATVGELKKALLASTKKNEEAPDQTSGSTQPRSFEVEKEAEKSSAEPEAGKKETPQHSKQGTEKGKTQELSEKGEKVSVKSPAKKKGIFVGISLVCLILFVGGVLWLANSQTRRTLQTVAPTGTQATFAATAAETNPPQPTTTVAATDTLKPTVTVATTDTPKSTDTIVLTKTPKQTATVASTSSPRPTAIAASTSSPESKPEPLGTTVDSFRVKSLGYWYEWHDEEKVYHCIYVGTKITGTAKPEGVPPYAELCLMLEIENLNASPADVQFDVYMDDKIVCRGNLTQMDPETIYARPMEAASGSYEYSIYLNGQPAATITLEQTIYTPPLISRMMYLGGKTYEIGSCTLGDLIAGGWDYDSLHKDKEFPSIIKPLEEITDISLELDGEYLWVGVTNLDTESCALYDCTVVRAQSAHIGDAYEGAVIGQVYNPQSEFFSEFEEYTDEYVRSWVYWKNGFYIMIDVDDNQLIKSIYMVTPLGFLPVAPTNTPQPTAAAAATDTPDPYPEQIGTIVDGFRVKIGYCYEWDEETGLLPAEYSHMNYVGTKVTSTEKPEGVPPYAELCLELEVENLNASSADVQFDVYMDGRMVGRGGQKQMEANTKLQMCLDMDSGVHEYSVYLNKQLAEIITLEQTAYTSPHIGRNMYLGGATYKIGVCTLGDLIAGGWEYLDASSLEDFWNDDNVTISPLESIFVNLEMDGYRLQVWAFNFEAKSCSLYDCTVVEARSTRPGDSYEGAVIGQTYNPQSELFNEFKEDRGEYGSRWVYCKNIHWAIIWLDDNQLIEEIDMLTPTGSTLLKRTE